mmetsp:Transcript_98552/g.279126  ORF Transcript_98552/g.279126 Transcript_98552/m.279126 type:complete len:252 (-) Transcript_98552:47-802(-)
MPMTAMARLVLACAITNAASRGLRPLPPTVTMSSKIVRQPSCSCQPEGPWAKPAARQGKCIFVDLGAANGNSFEVFRQRQEPYASANLPAVCAHSWEAWLMEANPLFTQDLRRLEQIYPGQVHSLAENACFSCDGVSRFHLDPNATHNHWGSTLTRGADPGSIEVPTQNLLRLLTLWTIPEDYVIVKMDIEGAEYDIVPCLARSQIGTNIDLFFVEVHPNNVNAMAVQTFNTAKQNLVSRGVLMPLYSSAT